MLSALRNIPFHYKFWLVNTVSLTGRLALVFSCFPDRHTERQDLDLAMTEAMRTATLAWQVASP